MIAQSLVSDLLRTCSHYVLSAADVMNLPVIGDADLHFTVDRHKFVVNVCVVPAVEELLLGSDWLDWLGLH